MTATRTGAIAGDATVASPLPSRDAAIDALRALAILGMFVIHAVLVLADRYPTTGVPAAVLWLCDGRAAATFVTLAGFGVARLLHGMPLTEAVPTLRRRALALWVLGVLNLIVWPGDILRLYGVALALAPWMVRASRTARLIAAAALVIVFPLVTLVVDWTTHWDLPTLTYIGTWTVDGFLRHLLYDGYRPVLPWLAFFLVGTVLAEWPLHDERVQRRLIAWGAALTMATVVTSSALNGWLVRAEPGMDALTREGIVGTTSLPPMPLFMLSAFGTTALLLGTVLMLVPRLPLTWRLVLSATGRRALTWYLLHIVVLMSAAALGAMHRLTAAAAIAAGIVLFGVAAVWSYRHRERSGTLERWLREWTRVRAPERATVRA